MILRTVLSIVASLALAMALVVGVELFSSVVHPFPAEIEGTPTHEQVCEHVARYPSWVLGVAAALWAGTVFASTWVATRIATRIHGVIIGLFLTLMVILNMSMLPYPRWFVAANLIAFPVATILGVQLGRRAQAPTTQLQEPTG